MDKRKICLCGACAAKLSAAYEVRKVVGGVGEKVLCMECRRRRYGGTYEVTAEGKTPCSK